MTQTNHKHERNGSVTDRRFNKALREGLLMRAREMRHQQTEAEAVLWKSLRGQDSEGNRFRRQYLIEPYIVDYYCHKAKLIVEVDGSSHTEQQEYDKQREADLIGLGYKILRFSNQEVLEDLGSVLARIKDKLR